MPVITKIQIVVEVQAERPFSEKETLENIRKIGTREALGRLTTAIAGAKFPVSIVGRPIVQSFQYIE